MLFAWREQADDESLSDFVEDLQNTLSLFQYLNPNLKQKILHMRNISCMLLSFDWAELYKWGKGFLFGYFLDCYAWAELTHASTDY